jgi:hypothetical protein
LGKQRKIPNQTKIAVTEPTKGPKTSIMIALFGTSPQLVVTAVLSVEKWLINLAKKQEVVAKKNSLETMEQEAAMDTQVVSTKIAYTMEQTMD